jgi:hypothetical protein
MLRVALLITFLFSTMPLVRAQDQPDEPLYLCYGMLPIVAPADVPLDFEQVFFESGFEGSSGGVALVNKSDKGIRYYLIVMEFLDAEGKYLASAPAYNVTDEDQGIPFDVPFKVWLKRNWEGGNLAPIPAKSASSKGFEIALSMLTCPTSVRVSMIQLRYDDDTTFKYVSESLNMSPTPAQAMELSDTEGGLRWSPAVVTGILQIDAKGRARILQVDSADVFRKWLQKEFNTWRFIPAWVEGKPATTRLPFVFFLGDATHPWVQVDVMKRKGIRGPFLVWPHLE